MNLSSASARVQASGRSHHRQKVCLIIRIALGLTFAYAGIVKLLDPKAFAWAISQYDLVPDVLLPLVAIGLPALELLAGVGLIFNVVGSLTAIFAMLVMFIVVLWYGILSGLDIDCGCFTEEELRGQASLWNAFYRDVALVGGVVFLYLARWYSMPDRQHQGLLWKMKRLM